MTTGFTYKYNLVSGTDVTPESTVTVIGPTTFNGNSCMKIQDVATVSAGKQYITDSYELQNTTDGWVIFAHSLTVTGGTGANLHTELQTEVPKQIICPPILEAGVVYHSNYTDVTHSVTYDGQVTDDTTSVSATIKLVSDTPTNITVPAGTFSCYQIVGTEVDTVEGQEPSTSTFTAYASAGVGVVKSIDSDNVIYQLTKFDAGTTGMLAFGVQPGASVTGSPVAPSPTVMVENAIGVVNTKDTSTVKLTILSGPSGAVLGGTTSVAAVAGVATFSNITLSKPGTYKLLASDGKLKTAQSFSFTVQDASKLAYTSVPTAAVAGTTLAAVKVAVQSAAGTVATGNTSSVTLAIASGPAGGTLTGTATVACVKGVATFSTLKFTKAGTYTLKATDGTLASATSVSIVVSPAAASKLVIGNQSTAALAGATLAPAMTVLVEDAFGNILTNDASTVTLTLLTKPVNGVLLGTLSTKAVKGVATFSALSMKIAGAYTIKATDAALAAATSKTITISPAAASKLVIAAQPTTGTAGKSLTPAMVVQVQDAYGNLCTTNSSNVSLSLATKPTGGTLLGTISTLAVKGVATFSTLSMKIAGAYTIKAIDGALASATSKAITINPAAAAKLVYAAQPTTGKAGVALSPLFKVYVEDTYGNVCTSDASTVALSILTGPTGGVLTGTASVKAVKGVATFSGLSLSKIGTYTIKAKDGVLATVTSKNVVIS